MPLISFTKADILRSKLLEAGWYGMTIKSFSEPTKSSGGDSVNWIVTFTLDEIPGVVPEGKELERYYNSKAKSMMLPLISAALEKTIDPANFDLDGSMLVGKKVDNRVAVENYEGRLINKISDDFVPYGKSKTMQTTPF